MYSKICKKIFYDLLFFVIPTYKRIIHNYELNISPTNRKNYPKTGVLINNLLNTLWFDHPIYNPCHSLPKRPDRLQATLIFF